MAIKNEVAKDLPLTLIDGQSRTAMAAADQVLMASGTAVLEGMLLKRPMVAAYRVAPMTARIIRLFNMIKSDYFTLPNNLAGEELVPEIIQENITPEILSQVIIEQFNQDKQDRQYMMQRFNDIHHELRQNASEQAAKTIYNVLESKKQKA